MTWEEAVKDLRSKPENKQAIIDNYFDADIDASVERFSKGEEFMEVCRYIPAQAKTVLDIGAGRGMAAYAFAKKGYKVTALEPDPSNDVGAGAIKYLSEKFNLGIHVTETFGENLPFDNNSFDVVYVRQVLHHANDLEKFCKEVQRVLKPGGVFIATREHVLSKEEDLQTFLDNHPLHKQYGGEHAFTLQTYLNAITMAGMKLSHILHPYASVINYAPITTIDLEAQFAVQLSKFTGKSIARLIMKQPALASLIYNLKAAGFNQPGRLYSFIAVKK